jgi:predicted nucleic acid-binding protein
MIVLDASVTLAWFFPDEASSYADAVLDHLHASRAFVPALWPLEVANVLAIAEHRQRATPAQADQFVQLLAALPIEVEQRAFADLVPELLALARLHALSAYDAAYLELALRLGLQLATLDTRLTAAAQTAGIATFAPSGGVP